MIIESGKCLKCGGIISKGNIPSNTYCEYEFETDAGVVFAVGVCNSCDIKPEEYPEVVSAVSASVPNIEFGNITKLRSIKGFRDIVLELQGGRCADCKKPIVDSSVMNGNRIICEFCKRGREENNNPADSFRNPDAGKSVEKEQPRERKHVQVQNLRSVTK